MKSTTTSRRAADARRGAVTKAKRDGRNEEAVEAFTAQLREGLSMFMDRPQMNVNSGETNVMDGPDVPGLTLDEISGLLQRRETRGWMHGHSLGYTEARGNAALVRDVAERAATAEALLFVVGKLEPVAKRLAGTDTQAKREGAAMLSVLAVELAQVAEEIRP